MDGGAFGGLTAGDSKPVAPAVGVAAATAVAGGDAPGVTPAIATAEGEDCAEGRAGVLEVDATAEFSATLSCFHHAKRGALWQPTTAARIASKDNDRSAVRFMTVAAQERAAETFATFVACRFR